MSVKPIRRVTTLVSAWFVSVTNHCSGLCGRLKRFAYRFASVAASAVVPLVWFVGQAAAQESGSVSNYCGDKPVPEAIQAVIDLLTSLQFWGIAIAGSAATLAYLYAGALLIFGTGDPQRVERAKTVIMYTTMGLVIVLLSGLLVELMVDTLCKSIPS